MGYGVDALRGRDINIGANIKRIIEFLCSGLLILIPVLDWSLTVADGESSYFLDRIQERKF